ncbi:hypothetical protein BT93_K1264 [Corymbia citriodora subsp. variegata]|nr:hypothetical protein BT93_K1264 [Corymbia citriodora subsp. variegata]
MCFCTLPPEPSLIIHMLIRKRRITVQILQCHEKPIQASRKTKQIHVIREWRISIVHLKKQR